MQQNWKMILAGFLVAFAFFLLSGCTVALDECSRAFEKCKYECGDGILSGVCKEECTNQYRECRELTQGRT